MSDIVPNECEEPANEGQDQQVTTCGPLTDVDWAAKSVCCGKDTPDFCHNPPFVQARMQDYYPSVKFFYGDEGEVNNLTHVQDTQPLLVNDDGEKWEDAIEDEEEAAVA